MTRGPLLVTPSLSPFGINTVLPPPPPPCAFAFPPPPGPPPPPGSAAAAVAMAAVAAAALYGQVSLSLRRSILTLSRSFHLFCFLYDLKPL
ncbi:unnamed protein product [Protopolystoma xenopodis]|uniref:Uncharacterized protein n=1 Tax=Protopolystoma xenopodis TaxID=117903 RepID=A0A3S4ZN96_9PLAT|nr:unnamed protein product [Protopolystoma xenopodis]